MQQTGALRRRHIDAKLRRHKSGNMGHLDGVIQHVLAIAGTVSHAAKKADEFGVETVYICLEHGALAFGLDGRVDFLLRLRHHLFDACGVNSAVLNELFKRQARHFAAHGIEAGDGDGFGGIVDDEVAAGQRFDAADVAALAADDAPLHFVVGERYDGNGDLACVIGGAALDSGGDNGASLILRLFLVLSFNLLDLHRHLMRYIVTDVGDKVLLCLLDGEARNLFEQFKLALLDERDLMLLILNSGDLVVERVALALDSVHLFVEIFFLLLEAAFLLLQL